MIDVVVIPLLKIVILLAGLLAFVAYLVLVERKVVAWVQVRLGPMRVGPHGALQPVADVLKLFLKEERASLSGSPPHDANSCRPFERRKSLESH